MTDKINPPTIELFATSNVYSRVMHFLKKGDQEYGHFHAYDHGTLLGAGKLSVEILDDGLKVISVKEYTAPAMILIKREYRHRLTALEDNTVAACIHALRDVEGDLLPPDALTTVVEISKDENRQALIQRRNPVNEVSDHLEKLGLNRQRFVSDTSLGPEDKTWF